MTNERHDALTRALTSLRDAVAGVTLDTRSPATRTAQAVRQDVLDRLDHHLLPRVRQPDAPLLVAVAGSTGVGKSTIVNTVAGGPVSRAGVLRPTTRRPVLVRRPEDARWFDGSRVPWGLSGVDGDDLPPGIAVLDVPDPEAVAGADPESAAQLLAGADLALFVTTAARYADAVPWNAVAEAAQRGIALAIVLDRVPAGGGDLVGEHLHSMLSDRGLDGVPVLVVEEVALDGGLLPAEAAAPLTEHLDSLVGTAERRDALVWRNVAGTLDGLLERVGSLAAATGGEAQEPLWRAAEAVAAAAPERPVEVTDTEPAEDIAEDTADQADQADTAADEVSEDEPVDEKPEDEKPAEDDEPEAAAEEPEKAEKPEKVESAGEPETDETPDEKAEPEQVALTKDPEPAKDSVPAEKTVPTGETEPAPVTEQVSVRPMKKTSPEKKDQARKKDQPEKTAPEKSTPEKIEKTEPENAAAAAESS